jgi:Protein of unknown function (DUF3800)
VYLIYVDDSGDPHHDLLVAVCIPVAKWTNYLASWKRYRKFLHRKFGFPPVVELHATEWVRRGDLKVTDPVSRTELFIPLDIPRGSGARRTRSDAFVDGLKTVASMKEVRIIGTYAPVASGSGALYGRLLVLLEAFLTAEDSYGVVWFDGTSASSESAMRQHHRGLHIDQRRVVEDPIPRDSAHSHLIQIADVVAYSLFASVRNAVGGGGRPEIANAYEHLTPLFASVNGERGLDGFFVPKRRRKKQ